MSKNKNKLIGLTGGIGAGKSTVADFFRNAGITVINADQLAREITEPGEPALAEIVSVFGTAAINGDGTLNRSHIRSQILEHPELRQRLEQITHPRIQALSKQRTEEAFAEGHHLVIYEAPLLFEAKSDHAMDEVICVIADDNIRIKRVMSRDNITREQAEKILQTQMPQEEKVARSRFVIKNDGDVRSLELIAMAVLKQIRAS